MNPTVPTNIPTGAVLAVFLNDEQIARLAPVWLPADGRVVNEPGSILHGATLPRLDDDRVILATSQAPGPYDPAPLEIRASGTSGLSEIDEPSSMVRGQFHGTPVWDVQQDDKRKYSVVLDTQVDETAGNVRVPFAFDVAVAAPTPRGYRLRHVVKVR